jgi:hypothetical protein
MITAPSLERLIRAVILITGLLTRLIRIHTHPFIRTILTVTVILIMVTRITGILITHRGTGRISVFIHIIISGTTILITDITGTMDIMDTMVTMETFTMAIHTGFRLLAPVTELVSMGMDNHGLPQVII